MILMIDNYDSFTYNLVQYLKQIGATVHTIRNDKVDLPEIENLNPSGIVISPGPGRPENAGISVSIIKHFYKKFPILGVCLGHQAIAYAFGGKIVSAKKLMHGKVSVISSDKKAIYNGIPETFNAMRYHSLSVSRDEFPECLKITAQSEDGEIMGIRHNNFPCEGIQFHPESIMTPVGKRILRNFINLAKDKGELFYV
ncbi:MAG: aminodeoxychorismate/anthranilate synthase component II [Desulfobacterales bacterium]|nr:aminodeoxychorismate/anthranilate synthase component II [Desulfobacterales bacterium]